MAAASAAILQAPERHVGKRYTLTGGSALSNADAACVLSDVLGRRGYPVVRSADAGASEYVYYRDHDGRIRRAVVSPGTDRLRFSNVPSSLLSEVISRLY